MNIPSISNQQATVSSDTKHKNIDAQLNLPKEVEAQPFIMAAMACDELQTMPSQKSISARESRLTSIMSQKRHDLAALIQSNTSPSESIPLLRTIEFFGLKFVFIPDHLSESISNKKLSIPGNVEKWLELLNYPNGKEEEVIERFRETGYQIKFSDELTSTYHVAAQKSLVNSKQTPLQPTLLITGIKEKEEYSIKNRFVHYKDTVAIKKLSMADEVDVSGSIMLSIFEEYPRTKCFSSKSEKNKTNIKIQPGKSYLSHDHPPRSYNNAVFVLDGVKNPINLKDILLIACERGMEELHYIDKTAEKRNILQNISGKLQCPVNIKYFDQSKPSIDSLKQRGFTIYASTLDPEAITLDQVKPVEKKAIIVGNEAHGISPESRELSDKKVMIPGKGFAQSLNVSAATAILADGLDPQIAKR